MVPYNEALITEKFQVEVIIVFRAGKRSSPSLYHHQIAGIEIRYEASGSPRERLRLIADNRLEIKPSILDHQQAENRT
ncbi:hypothetical protein ALC53_02764 [Atta colombica]|uniref:Uncharacterized protein n=1 Tax=Atta colombica TaxID=520822 RepID=A0A195BP39_9HYME|nr:hypothetical protein ALC53_02764 [Atta colombica]